MELHRQQCQKCKSFNMRNILVRNPGEQQMVYVRCVDCHEFVALYKLRDYYHHEKGIEK
jgi:RNase P subunit RPR2